MASHLEYPYEENRQAVNALTRAAEKLEAEVAAMNPRDYSAEFPAEDARLIRLVIRWLEEKRVL